MGHDAPFAGHLASRLTRQRIRLSFWFPEMDQIIADYCVTCDICQRHAPLRTIDRVPVSPIPLDDELRFSHLVMDCIGPIVSDIDPVVGESQYNYVFVICECSVIFDRDAEIGTVDVVKGDSPSVDYDHPGELPASLVDAGGTAVGTVWLANPVVWCTELAPQFKIG